MYRDILSAWVSHYGYAGIFSALVLGIVGLPIPDEFLLILSGYLVFKNVLDLAPTIGVAILGTFCGVMASYTLGRISGKYLQRLDKRGRLQRVRYFLERFGRWTLVFGYLIPGIRNMAGLSAGAANLRLRTFAPLAFAGAVLSSSICVSFGYVFGLQAEWIFHSLQKNLLFALVAGLAIWLARRRFRQVAPPQRSEPEEAC